jgi:hypothetical protein
MKKQIMMALAVGLMAMNIGCAKEKSNSDTDTTGTTTTTTTTTESSSVSSNTVALKTTASKLAALFVNSVPNNPSGVTVTIDLSNSSESILISYYENGVTKEAAFGTVHPYNSSVSGTRQGWVTHDGSPWWKGFFQDAYGAIVIVIDSTISTGDGSPSDIVGGRIYFQNFCRTYPCNPYQGSQKMCWDITAGPYDCRTFISGDSVVLSSSKYPNNKGDNAANSYQLLGTFTGLSRSAASIPEE